MSCDNCIHQKACISAYVSMGHIIDTTKENEYKHTILKCKEFEDKEKYQSALEKQIPKKPEGIYDDNAGIEAESRYELCLIGHCTVCGREVQQGMNYCMNCGQALDWSE